MNAKITFLNGTLNEKITYLNLKALIVHPNPPKKVNRLFKTL
jgi:hypothetical protein